MRIFLLILFFSLTGLSQTIDSAWSIVPIYYSSLHNLIEPVDSLVEEKIEDYEIKSPYNSITKSYTVYSKHEKYQLKNNKTLSIDYFNDSIILYREFKKDSKNEFDSLITYGDLKFNLSFPPTKIQKTRVTSYFGEDSVAYDSLYLLLPNGIWSINRDDKIFQNGVFSFGLKTGTWFNFYSEYYDRHLTPFISSLAYEKGILKHEKMNDLSKMNLDISTLIEGKWFNIGHHHEDYAFCRESKCSLFFTRDSTLYNRFYLNVIDFLNLNKNKTYLKEVTFTCGNGIKIPDPSIKRYWEIIKKDEIYFLKLDSSLFKIEYLTQDELILSFF